jgi:hypothetical protein
MYSADIPNEIWTSPLIRKWRIKEEWKKVYGNKKKI